MVWEQGKEVPIVRPEEETLRRNTKSIFKYQKHCYMNEADFVVNSAKEIRAWITELKPESVTRMLPKMKNF